MQERQPTTRPATVNAIFRQRNYTPAAARSEGLHFASEKNVPAFGWHRTELCAECRGMEQSLKDDVVSLTDFARNTRGHTRSLAKHGRPRILTHNGRAAAVVLSVEAFESLQSDAAEHRLDLRLREALAGYARGQRGTPSRAVFSRLRRGLPPAGTDK